jgi:hypothetical protein
MVDCGRKDMRKERIHLKTVAIVCGLCSGMNLKEHMDE